MLKIRLRQQGRRNNRVFRLVLTDVRYPRDGKYIELLGSYNAHAEKTVHNLKDERIKYWLDHGAELTERAKALVKATAPDVLVTYQKKKAKLQEKKRVKRRTSRKKAEAVTV